jgi:hypothetical protein
MRPLKVLGRSNWRNLAITSMLGLENGFLACFGENALLIISTGMRLTVTVKEKEDAVRAFAFEVAFKLGTNLKHRSPKMLLNKENVRV